MNNMSEKSHVASIMDSKQRRGMKLCHFTSHEKSPRP